MPHSLSQSRSVIRTWLPGRVRARSCVRRETGLAGTRESEADGDGWRNGRMSSVRSIRRACSRHKGTGRRLEEIPVPNATDVGRSRWISRGGIFPDRRRQRTVTLYLRWYQEGSVGLQMFWGFRAVCFSGWSVFVAHGWVICYPWDSLQLTPRHLFVQLLQLIEQLLCIVDGGKKNCENIVWFMATRDSHAVTGAELMFLSMTQLCWPSQIFYVLLSSRFTVVWPMWINPFIYWKHVVNVGRLCTHGCVRLNILCIVNVIWCEKYFYSSKK